MKIIHILTAILVSITPLFAEVKFSHNFECGSIGEATLVSTKGDSFEHYSLNLKADPKEESMPDSVSNKGWFYFKMTGVKDKLIALDIEANSSKRPFYSYDNVNFTRFGADEVPMLDSTITMRYTQDEVYISYFPPYTTVRNHEQIEKWNKHEECISFIAGYSEQGRPQEALLLGNGVHRGLIPNGKGRIDEYARDKGKRVVYIQGRVSPADAPSSWHLEALIDSLLSESRVARMLRKDLIYYIIPMINPDGVFDGYNKCNAKGVNLEENYKESRSKEAAEIKSVKWLMNSFSSSGFMPQFVLNLKSQSDPKATYMIYAPESTSWEFNRMQMLLASLTACENPYMNYEDFSYSDVKKSYIESYVQNRFMERASAITFGTPHSYYCQNPTGEWVTIDNLKKFASITLRSMCDFLEKGTEDRVICEEPNFVAKTTRQTDFRKIFFGKRYLVTAEENVEVNYTVKLPRGRYKVYMWGVGENQAKVPERQNRWNEIGRHIQEFDTETTFKYIEPIKGQAIDRIIFVRID